MKISKDKTTVISSPVTSEFVQKWANLYKNGLF